MRVDRRLSAHFAETDAADPRDSQGAEVIDLATRSVLPAVAQRKPRSDALGLAAGVAVVALLGAVTLWSLDGTRTAREKVASKPAATAPIAPLGTAPTAADLAPGVPPEAMTPPVGSAPPAPAPQAVLSAPPQAAAQPITASNPRNAPTLVYDAGTAPNAMTAPIAPGAQPAPSTAPTGEDFAARVGGVGGATATAAMTIDPRTTVTQGTLIPAVLETAIDTDVPGYVRAVVSADVRSFDGARVLIPRSSRLIGQYRSGLQAGQKRAYVIWTRLIRPDGASVNIASPAVAFGGETGLPGRVNSHFFERFGSAMLLSVVGGLSALGGNPGVVIAGGGQSAAAAAVGQSGQIGPTIRVRPGEPIRVFTARDLDFSGVSAQ